MTTCSLECIDSCIISPTRLSKKGPAILLLTMSMILVWPLNEEIGMWVQTWVTLYFHWNPIGGSQAPWDITYSEGFAAMVPCCSSECNNGEKKMEKRKSLLEFMVSLWPRQSNRAMWNQVQCSQIRIFHLYLMLDTVLQNTGKNTEPWIFMEIAAFGDHSGLYTAGYEVYTLHQPCRQHGEIPRLGTIANQALNAILCRMLLEGTSHAEAILGVDCSLE